MLFALTVFRLWYGGAHQLLQDEAYYWQWSRHLDWGYYDNTPLLAVVIRVFTTLLGPTELGVRAGAVFCALVVSIFIYLIMRRLAGARVALASVAMASILPLFALGADTMTQDPVQLAFWAATLYVVLLALDGRGWLWILAGALAGLTAMAKLNGLLLLPSILLFLALSPAHRHWLRRPEPYLAAAIALAIFSPFVWWNHTHQNAFWLHIHAMGTRNGEHDPPLKWFWRFLGDQLFLMSPLLMLMFLRGLWVDGKRSVGGKNDALLFLWCPSVVVFGATALLSLKSKVEGNWPAAAYVTAACLLAWALTEAWDSGARGRRWAAAAVGLSVLISAVILMPNLIYAVGYRFPNPSKDRTSELYGWRDMAARVQSERSAMGGDPFVFSVNYRMPSEMAFYLPGKPQTYSLFLKDRPNEYMFWENPDALKGRDAVYVEDTDDLNHLDDLKAVFTRVEPQPELLLYRDPPYGRKPIRTIQIVRCYGFKGYDPLQWRDGW
ncbi:hypothetical protein CCAX7_27490 [Capsulimonas corticalis]|uniref:Uncharacterized protein n=1 Tax=Capsulimonas corticalis TaxID=2219043 RepID=A0A402CTK7_9BACT|nr:hypothetical protein CCAX7_27490 [Capsulimonas corticalis]